MKKPTGRIAKAIRCFMGGGGGGGGSVNVPSLSQEIKQTTQGFNKQIYPTFQRFTENEPLISQISSIAPELSGYSQANASAIQPYIQSILAHPYDVPPELLNQATQAARGGFQARGNVYGNQALAGELMGRENVRQQRIQSAMGLAQQQAGLSGSAEQLLGYPESVRTGSFATLMNPVYGLAAAQLGAQTQANIAGAQSDASGKASTTGLASSALTAVGTVAAAY